MLKCRWEQKKMTIEGLTDTSRVEGSRQSLLEFNISELLSLQLFMKAVRKWQVQWINVIHLSKNKMFNFYRCLSTMFKLSRETFSVLTLGPNIYSTLKQLASQMYMYTKALRTLKTTLFPAVPTSKEFDTTKKSWEPTHADVCVGEDSQIFVRAPNQL